LTINQPGDRYEREADQVAEMVLRMPEPGVQRQPLEEEEEELQMKEAGPSPVPATAPPIVQSVIRTPGHPLDVGTRASMEPRFGADFGSVRVHTDAQAAESAQAINARAYTVGRDVVFGAGQYAPGTGAGRRLLAHELAHVVQQREAGGTLFGGPHIQRWTFLGEERWHVSPFPERVMKVWTGTESEWTNDLKDMDEREEYWASLKGFLDVSNDPSIVNRTQPPRHLGNVPYTNTITRAPNDHEKLEFLRALYNMGGDLDLWRGGLFEGGAWAHFAEDDLATFLRKHQGMLIADVSAQGRVINDAGVQAIAEQGGRRPTMAMIINAGATAHKGVDLVMTANRMSGQARQTAHATAMETIRNAGRVIRETLEAHDARVAFNQQVTGAVFDTVWGAIPGGGTLATAGMNLLKTGLKEGLRRAQAQSGPRDQADAINAKFVETCNNLVRSGHILSADAQDAINGFEAVRR
jgi:hypothetical protein